MKKYILTSPTLNGDITFGYNDNGYLLLYDNKTQSTDGQIIGLLNRLPFQEKDLEPMIKGTEAKLEQVPDDLSFDAFWGIQAPGKKINRKRCEPLWEKMTDAKRYKAIVAYPQYLAACQRTTRGILDPENYLKRESYETDWRQVK